ncbi:MULTISPECIES: arginase family protein [Mesorhizobium]|uniref:arginase family protein n=1 Tax=Mesorhizobium TaxID=68287 RepID=UPI0003CF4523|nr:MULTISPECIES: arginase family protein [Mesorhizobium]ESY64674.1 arginase [Mesorhizobium sp. LNHC232B00]WJI38865.1 arginase family protein [Mesorhizobium opportunistum]
MANEVADMESALKPRSVMPMLGTASSDTFMGVAACNNLDDLDAEIVVLGIPCATPYPGAVEYTQANLDAPRAIRDGLAIWSATKDRYDWDLDGLPFCSAEDRVCDYGDLPTRVDKPEENRKLIHAAIAKIVEKGAIPVVLGGDDSVPVPVIKALSAKANLTILQIDAHIDWRNEVAGERYGLSSVMRRASEEPHVANLVQVGARGLSSAGPQEIADAKAWGVRFFPAQVVRQKGIQPIVDAIPSGSNVHINLDFDGLDPTIMPAVFVPAPGGLLYWEVVDLIKGVAAKATICSIAAVEFVPSKDPDGNSALTAGRIISLAIGSILKKPSV